MDSTLQLLPLLRRLNDHGVKYCVVGGVAATIHGSARATYDLDVCAPLDEANATRILSALRDIRPRHRMRPDKLPLRDDPSELRGFRNLYLLTDLGVIDFLTEIDGVGAFDDVARHAYSADLGGVVCMVLDLETLIAAKRAAGREKDRLAVIELEVIRQRRPAPPADVPPTP